MALKKICAISAMALLITLSCLAQAAWLGADGVVIEQIHADLPEIRVYYRADSAAAPGDFTAELNGGGGSAGIVEMDAEADVSPEGCAYIFLVDVSRTISSRQMSEIKRALSDFYDNSLRQGADRFVLIPFGDRVYYSADDGRGFLDGSEDAAEAARAIELLDRSDGQTAFYDAVQRAASMAAGGAGLPERKVIIAMSDGDDDPKDKEVGKHFSYDDVLGETGGVPVYALGFESEAIRDLELFQNISATSGGEFWKIAPGADLGGQFEELRAAVLGVRMLRLRSDEVGADSRGYTLRVMYGGEDLLPSPLEIKPSVPDTRPPSVAGGIEQLASASGIRLRFDERLDASSAGDAARYIVKDSGGDSVEVQAAEYAAEKGGSHVDLIFAKNPYSGSYTLDMTGLTDNAQNPLDAGPIEFTYRGEAAALKYIRVIFVDFWWAVLIAALAVIALVVMRVSYTVLKKRKGIVKIEGKVGFGDMVEYMHEFETPETRRLCLIVTDLRGDAQKVELDVNKSIFVGRSPSNNLSFDDDSMSRQHFVIEVEDDAFFITDLQTTNGTFLNGVRLNGKRRLEYNDVITAGHEKFVFKG